jgi:hypothetical protein
MRWDAVDAAPGARHARGSPHAGGVLGVWLGRFGGGRLGSAPASSRAGSTSGERKTKT